MRRDLQPKNFEQALVHLIEECSEVIKAACKIQRFGTYAIDPKTGIKYDNITDLLIEIQDTKRAMYRLSHMPRSTKPRHVRTGPNADKLKDAQ